MFKVEDCGCYADGSLGHQHVRDVLANLVEQRGKFELGKELRGEMSDDASEEDDAIECLNAFCEGCYFTFADGDLMLLPAEEDEPETDDRIVTYTAPAAWASYWINGDASGLDDEEIKAADAAFETIIARNPGAGPHPCDCTEEGFMHRPDFGGACDACTYTFFVA